ncbi:hypothetical protein V8C35DRAFT_316928 [Trichoderma chlorosporum]
MATHASRAEIIQILEEVIRSLQHYPENESTIFRQESAVDFFGNLLPFFRIALQAITRLGKGLPKELQWSKKLQTIAALEELKENHTISQDSASTTQETPTTEERTPNSTSHTSHDNASTTQETPTTEERTPSSASHTSHDNASTTENTPSTKKCPTSTATTEDGPIDEIINKLMKQENEFHLWTQNPSLFWNLTTNLLELHGSTLKERTREHCEHTIQHKSNVVVQKFIHRFDSVLMYLRFRKYSSISKVPIEKVVEYLEYIGGPVKHKTRYKMGLDGGRKWLKLCHQQSKDTATFAKFRPDVINFDDLNYGYLFLNLDDRAFEGTTSRHYIRLDDVYEEVKSQNIMVALEKSGAKHTAKILLQSRQAFIEPNSQQRPALSGIKSNNMTATDHFDDEESNSTVATEHSHTEANREERTSPHNDDENNAMVATKRARAETDSDDTRASKRSCREIDLNNTITSEGGRFQSLLEAAVEAAGQNATASETAIANLASGVDTMQLNYARLPNSETEYLNSVDLQGRDPEEHNAIDPSVLNNNTKLDASLPNTSGFKDMATLFPNGDPPMTDQFFLNGQTTLDAILNDMAPLFPNGDPPMTDQFFLNGQTTLDASSPDTNTCLLNDEEFGALINDDAFFTEFLSRKKKPKPVDASDTNTLQTSIHIDGEPIAGSPVAGE